MIETIGTICTVIAVIGVWLNNHRRRECFLLWLFTNFATGMIHLYLQVYSLAIRDLIFFVLAIHGHWKWGKK